ncbi:MAG: hypothetical protein ACM3IJ_03605 [Candidatus Levyibacteriota bacterium]
MKTVVAFFPERNYAEEAYRELESNEFYPESISVMKKQNEEVVISSGGKFNHVFSATVTGLVVGAIIGAAVGTLIWNKILNIPGFSYLLIARPFTDAIGFPPAVSFAVAAAASAAILAGIFGIIIGLAIPVEKSRITEEKIHDEGVLLALATSSIKKVVDAKKILERHDPSQVRTLSLDGSDSHDAGQEEPYESERKYPKNVHVLEVGS